MKLGYQLQIQHLIHSIIQIYLPVTKNSPSQFSFIIMLTIRKISMASSYILIGHFYSSNTKLSQSYLSHLKPRFRQILPLGTGCFRIYTSPNILYNQQACTERKIVTDMPCIVLQPANLNYLMDWWKDRDRSVLHHKILKSMLDICIDYFYNTCSCQAETLDFILETCIQMFRMSVPHLRKFHLIFLQTYTVKSLCLVIFVHLTTNFYAWFVLFRSITWEKWKLILSWSNHQMAL